MFAVTRRIEPLTANDFSLPVLQRYPIPSIKEERRLQEDAADQVVVRCAWNLNSSISCESSPHLFLSPRPVFFSERLPHDAGGKDSEVAEETAANNIIVWAMELEQQWFAYLESAELLVPTGLPEINLVDSAQVRQEVEPVTIGDSDVESNTLSSMQTNNSEILCGVPTAWKPP
jgi:hypothetical protein